MNGNNGEGPSDRELFNNTPVGGASNNPHRLSDRTNPARPDHPVDRRDPANEIGTDDGREGSASPGMGRQSSEELRGRGTPKDVTAISMPDSPHHNSLVEKCIASVLPIARPILNRNAQPPTPGPQGQPISNPIPHAPTPPRQVDPQPSTSSQAGLPPLQISENRPALDSPLNSAPDTPASPIRSEQWHMDFIEDEKEDLTDEEVDESQDSSMSSSPVPAPHRSATPTDFHSSSSVVQSTNPNRNRSSSTDGSTAPKQNGDSTGQQDIEDTEDTHEDDHRQEPEAASFVNESSSQRRNEEPASTGQHATEDTSPQDVRRKRQTPDNTKSSSTSHSRRNRPSTIKSGSNGDASTSRKQNGVSRGQQDTGNTSAGGPRSEQPSTSASAPTVPNSEATQGRPPATDAVRAARTLPVKVDDFDKLMSLAEYEKKILEMKERSKAISSDIQKKKKEKREKEEELEKMEQSYQRLTAECSAMDKKINEDAAARSAAKNPGRTEPVKLEDFNMKEVQAYYALKEVKKDKFEALGPLRKELTALNKDAEELEKKSGKLREKIREHKRTSRTIAKSIADGKFCTLLLILQRRKREASEMVAGASDNGMEDGEVDREEMERDQEIGEVQMEDPQLDNAGDMEREEEEDKEPEDDNDDTNVPATSSQTGGRQSRRSGPSTPAQKQNGSCGSKRQRTTTGSASAEEDRRAKRPAPNPRSRDSFTSPPRRVLRSSANSRVHSRVVSRSQSPDQAPRTRSRESSASRSATKCADERSTSRRNQRTPRINAPVATNCRKAQSGHQCPNAPAVPSRGRSRTKKCAGTRLASRSRSHSSSRSSSCSDASSPPAPPTCTKKNNQKKPRCAPQGRKSNICQNKTTNRKAKEKKEQNKKKQCNRS